MTSSLRIVGLPEPESRLIGSLLEGHGFAVAIEPEAHCGAGSVEPAQVLTARHVDVLRALHEHGSAPRAAAALGISVKTVNAHLYQIHERLGVRQSARAICWACRRGLLKG